MAAAANARSAPKPIEMAVHTDEDAALDRELERMAAEAPPMPTISDRDQSPDVVKEKNTSIMLCDHLDVKPASTINELMDQCHQAKAYGCDSIYGTEAIIKHYCRNHYPTDVGYFIFHNIKVYIPGFFEQAVKRDNLTTLKLGV